MDFQSFLNKFKMRDNSEPEYDDEYDDDIFEDDDEFDYDDDFDDEEDSVIRSPRKSSGNKFSSFGTQAKRSESRAASSPAPKYSHSSNVVTMTGQKKSASFAKTIHFLNCNDFNDAQEATNKLKEGKIVVLNLRGIDIDAAQRIVDFVGGACYGINGELKAASEAVFVAAPYDVELTGEFRDEILTRTGMTKNMRRY